MAKMADPIFVLLGLQQDISAWHALAHRELDEGYKTWHQELDNGERHLFAKIIDGEIRALSIFGLEEPFNGVPRYSVGYAVKENHRGRGLALEAVNKGLTELEKIFSRAGTREFYLEALIDEKNTHSIRVAENLFPKPGIPKIDEPSGTPSLLFYKLFQVR